MDIKKKAKGGLKDLQRIFQSEIDVSKLDIKQIRHNMLGFPTAFNLRAIGIENIKEREINTRKIDILREKLYYYIDHIEQLNSHKKEFLAILKELFEEGEKVQKELSQDEKEIINDFYFYTIDQIADTLIHHFEAKLTNVKNYFDKLTFLSRNFHLNVKNHIDPYLWTYVSLNEVIQNILANSDKYAFDHPEPDNKVIIKCHKQVFRDRITITVEDNGKGLDPKYKENPELIFERGETTRGTGIGLESVRKNLRKEEGDIKYIKTQKGLKFEISLPVVEIHE